MDIEALVEELHGFIEESQQKKGAYWLAMLVGSADITPSSTWSLVLSAPWADAEGERTALTDIIYGLKSSLSLEAQSKIGRVTMVRTNDPFIEGIRDSIGLRPRAGCEGRARYAIYQDCSINGYEVPYGIVIVS